MIGQNGESCFTCDPRPRIGQGSARIGHCTAGKLLGFYYCLRLNNDGLFIDIKNFTENIGAFSFNNMEEMHVPYNFPVLFFQKHMDDM